MKSTQRVHELMTVEMTVEECGTKEGTPVLLLHGLPSSPADFVELAADFSDCRFIVPHLPGYAPSPPQPGKHGVKAIEDGLVRMLEALGVERPLLVGYSMGGYRALSLALRIPTRGCLILGGLADPSPEERGGMRGFAGAIAAKQDIRPIAGPRFLSEAHRAAHPEDIAKVEAWLDAATAETLVEELEDMAGCPSLLPRLHEIDAPIVARAGELDVAVPVAHAEAIVKHARKGTLEIVQGAGHALLYEDRQGCVASLRRLLQ